MNVPEFWNMKIADDISLKISKGTTPPKDEISSKNQIPFLRVNNLSLTFNGCLDFSSDFIFVSKEAHEKFLSRSKAYPEDVLMNIVGPPLGKIALLDSTYPEYNMNQAIVFYRLDKIQIDVNFFLAYLSSFVAQEWLSARSKKTSGQQNLTIETCKLLPVPLPPLPEQKKIAAILGTWDKAIATTEQLLANSQQQKKALMQQLLTGKKRLLDEDGERFSGEWQVRKLGAISDMNSGGTPKSSVPEYFGGGIPWVSIADMTKCGKRISKTEKTLSAQGLANSSARMYPKNTILFAMYASIGECSIAEIEVCSSQAILGIRPKRELDFEYLYFYLASLKDKIKLQGQQGTQSNLNAAMVKDFKIPLPNIDEQKAIALVLTFADREIEVLQTQLEALKQEKKALMQQLLTGKRRVIINH